MNDDDDQKAYTWEAGYADGLNLGDVLEEDEAGSIEKSIAKYLHDARKKQRSIEKPTKIRLGIMRYVYLVVDCSKYMPNKALPPSKFFVTMKAIDTFLDKFFEQNPIVHVGVIICKDKKAERCVNLTGNIRQIKEQLSTVGEAVCGGDFSLQNGLQLAMANLKGLPGHVSKEIIVLMASLSTVDLGNIFGTMELLKMANIRCSVIGLSAEMFVCKQLAKVTNGKYDVVLDTSQMDLLFSQHTVPPPTSKATECNAVRVGFPHQVLLSVSPWPDSGHGSWFPLRTVRFALLLPASRVSCLQTHPRRSSAAGTSVSSSPSASSLRCGSRSEDLIMSASTRALIEKILENLATLVRNGDVEESEQPAPILYEAAVAFSRFYEELAEAIPAEDRPNSGDSAMAVVHDD